MEEHTANGHRTSGDGFLWIGNNLSVDFANTEIITSSGERGDLLPDIGELLRWLTHSGILTTTEARAVAENEAEQHATILQRIKRARGATRVILEALAAGSVTMPTDSVSTINEALRARTGFYALRPNPPTLEFVTGENADAQAGNWQTEIAGRLAHATADFLSRADATRVRACENPNCILLYYDTSKNHTRRWCRMEACGNRAKAAAFYEAHKKRRATSESTTE